MNYIDFIINDKHYVQRNEFSKIIETDKNNNKFMYDSVDLLPSDIKETIIDYLETRKNPEKYFEYNFIEDSNDMIEITKYIGDKKNVFIPNCIDGYKVNTLGKVFYSNKIVENIYIEDHIDNIQEYFATSCSNLRSISLPKQITKIPDSCFETCINLETINLENIRIIGDCSFGNCSSLSNLKLSKLEEIGSYAFGWCLSIKSINIPNLIHLKPYAFVNCKELETVKIGENTKRVGHNAFEKCESLKNINLPNLLNTIERNLFRWCYSLETITLPINLTTIENSAFRNTGLKGEINLPNTLIQIEDSAFLGCDFSKINMSKNTRYHDNAFAISQLSKINIYDSYIDNIKNKIKTYKERGF